MSEGRAFKQPFGVTIHFRPGSFLLNEASKMARGMAERCWETGVVPCVFTGGGSAVRAGDGGKGKIPDFDAHAGEFHGVPSAFLLSDG